MPKLVIVYRCATCEHWNRLRAGDSHYRPLDTDFGSSLTDAMQHVRTERKAGGATHDVVALVVAEE